MIHTAIHIFLVFLKWYVILAATASTAVLLLGEWRHQRTRRHLRDMHARHEAASRADALARSQRAVRVMPMHHPSPQERGETS